MKQKLLFLIADTGGGHRATARAVAQAVDAAFPDKYDIATVDPFVETAPRYAAKITGLYAPIARYVRWLWGFIYYLTNSKAAVFIVTHFFLRNIKPGLRKLIIEQQPAVVISFHPLLNHITVSCIKDLDSGTKPFVITVVTDYINLHPFWFAPHIDGVVVPTVQALKHCRDAHIPSELCHVFGLPIGPAFSVPPLTWEEKHIVRKKLGIDSKNPLIVICGGADGAGKIHGLTAALATSKIPYDAAIICGNNAHLLSSLQHIQVPKERNIQFLGFVNNMVDWLHAADIVVTKAGPGTIMEALCSGSPFIVSWYLPGQERGTVKWLENEQVSTYTSSPQKILDLIHTTLSASAQDQESLLVRINALATPFAAQKTALLIDTFASKSTSTP